jgi:GH15 family glucan-1,4-alpha-glucosidase
LKLPLRNLCVLLEGVQAGPDLDVPPDVGPHVLREYGLLADGERGVLVGPRGDLAWLCAPRWDSDAVFASLLGGEGCYAVTPAGTRFTWGGHYEENTLIWRSRWVTENGIVECREALAYPADPRRAVLLRRVMAVAGPARVDVALDVRAAFGQHTMEIRRTDQRCWQGRSGPVHLFWQGVPDAVRTSDGTLRATLEIDEGDFHDQVLQICEDPVDGPLDPVRTWAGTEKAWADAVPRIEGTIADGDAAHSYAVLRGLTSAAGGMVAAATTSLPERARMGSNYDYRFAWVRDQCYAGQAVAEVGAVPLLDEAVGFVSGRLLEDGPQLAPAYTVDGNRVPDEAHPDLPGYPGGTVTTGNWVNGQFQLDAFGEALLLLTAAARHDRLDSHHWRAVEAAADAIAQRWREPDAGIWELDDRRWAHSRLTCAAGLRAAASVAPANQAATWSSLADTLVADADRDCLHPSGRWQRAPGDERVDAALLVPALRGAVPADDPRSVATLEAVRAELGRDGYLYRFRHDERPLSEAEGAFLLCGFWMAMAEHQRGRHVHAARWFERNRAACGPPGLLTEEYDVVQRQLRGNLPQAFVHALLIESAHRLADPPSEGDGSA